MDNLALTLAYKDQYVEAEKLLRQTRDIQRRVLGPDDPATAQSTYNLACVEALSSNRDEALSLLREAIDHGLSSEDDLDLENDPDLKSLHGDPRFDAVVAHAKQKAVTSEKPK